MAPFGHKKNDFHSFLFFVYITSIISILRLLLILIFFLFSFPFVSFPLFHFSLNAGFNFYCNFLFCLVMLHFGLISLLFVYRKIL